MKYIFTIVLILPLFLCKSCTVVENIPAYTVEKVLAIAREFSPECKIRVTVDGGYSP